MLAAGATFALGYAANGALAIVVDGDVVGIEIEGIAGGAPLAARFADDGGAAGCSPVAAMACGVDAAEGSVGAAERATSDVSSGA